MELVKEKKRVVRTAKSICNRQIIHEASTTANGIWKLAKWALTAGHLPRPVPQFPPLHAGDSEATTFEAKVDILHNEFFTPPLEADLFDMQDHIYPENIQQDFRLCEDDIVYHIKQPNRLVPRASRQYRTLYYRNPSQQPLAH